MKIPVLKNVIAIDLGTDFTRIYYKGEILNEPSVIAYDASSGTVIALGQEAYDMIGKNPPSVTVSKPLSCGVVVDFDLACQMLQGFLSKISGILIKPTVMITIPACVTEVQRRAITDILRESDINDVYVIESPIAGAIGANCDVNLARGMMLIDFGGGKCDISVISLGQTVLSRSIKLSGNDFTLLLKKYIEEKHNLIIGINSAERLKKSIGSVYMREHNSIEEVSGYNKHLKKPEKIVIRSDETREAFSPLISKIAAEIKKTLDDIPTALLGDIMDDGILLIGGGAQLFGMAKALRMELNMKVFLAEDADMCVIHGASFVAENMENFDGNTYIYKKG